MTSDEMKIIQSALSEMNDSMVRVGAERDLQKEIIAKIKEETTITPKVFRRMARVYYNSNFSEEAAFNDEFEETYEAVFSG